MKHEKLSPNQTRFYKGKTVHAVTKTEITYANQKFTCPYCLYTGHIQNFRVKLKHGYSEKRFKCPDCGITVMRKTLTEEKTVEQFAKWMAYEMSWVWKKVSWKKFSKRLKQMGIARQFWDAYHKHKADIMGDTLTYEEAMVKEQEEWAKEEGLI